MHYLRFDHRRIVCGLLIGAAALVGFPVPSPHAGSASDSASVKAPAPPNAPEPPTRKRIVIGGSGVRIEDEGTSVSADSTDKVDFNFDFKYDGEEHGEDIVKVGESVYVAAGDVVPGDVVVFGGNAIIEGTVAGSVVVIGRRDSRASRVRDQG